MSRPLTRVYGDKNCQRFIESMQTETWQALYESDANWYSRFITVVQTKVRNVFPTSTSFKETYERSALDNDWTKIKH